MAEALPAGAIRASATFRVDTSALIRHLAKPALEEAGIDVTFGDERRSATKDLGDLGLVVDFAILAATTGVIGAAAYDLLKAMLKRARAAIVDVPIPKEIRITSSRAVQVYDLPLGPDADRAYDAIAEDAARRHRPGIRRWDESRGRWVEVRRSRTEGPAFDKDAWIAQQERLAAMSTAIGDWIKRETERD